MFDQDTPIQMVINDPVFGDYGRLLFPMDAGYFSGDTLGDLHLAWYSHIDPNETVEIINTLHDRAAGGETVFYDIYTEAEKAADPDKRDTGLFFFKGTPDAKFAVCNAGGGCSGGWSCSANWARPRSFTFIRAWGTASGWARARWRRAG